MRGLGSTLDVLHRGLLGVGIIAVPAAFARLGWAVSLSCLVLLAAASQFSRLLHTRLLSALDAATLALPQRNYRSQGHGRTIFDPSVRSTHEQLVRYTMRSATFLTPPLYHVACVAALQQIFAPDTQIPSLVLGLFLASAAGVLSQVTFLLGESGIARARRMGAVAMVVALLLLTAAQLDVLQKTQESGMQPQTDIVAAGDWSSYLVGIMILIFASCDRNNWLLVRSVSNPATAQKPNTLAKRQQPTSTLPEPPPAIIICPPADFVISDTAPTRSPTNTNITSAREYNHPSSADNSSPVSAGQSKSVSAEDSQPRLALVATLVQFAVVAAVGTLGYATFGHGMDVHAPITSLLSGELGRAWVILVNSVLFLALLLGYSAHLHLWGSMLLTASLPKPVAEDVCKRRQEVQKTALLHPQHEQLGQAVPFSDQGGMSGGLPCQTPTSVADDVRALVHIEQPDARDSALFGIQAVGPALTQPGLRHHDATAEGVHVRDVYSLMEPAIVSGAPAFGLLQATLMTTSTDTVTAVAMAVTLASTADTAGLVEISMDSSSSSSSTSSTDDVTTTSTPTNQHVSPPTSFGVDIQDVTNATEGDQEIQIPPRSLFSTFAAQGGLREPLLPHAGEQQTHSCRASNLEIHSGFRDGSSSQDSTPRGLPTETGNSSLRSRRLQRLKQRAPRPLSAGDELLLRLLGSAAGASVGWVLGYGLPYFADLVALVGSLGGLWGLLVLPCVLMAGIRGSSSGNSSARSSTSGSVRGFTMVCRVVAVLAAGVSVAGMAAATKQLWLVNSK